MDTYGAPEFILNVADLLWYLTKDLFPIRFESKSGRFYVTTPYGELSLVTDKRKRYLLTYSDKNNNLVVLKARKTSYINAGIRALLNCGQKKTQIVHMYLLDDTCHHLIGVIWTLLRFTEYLTYGNYAFCCDKCYDIFDIECCDCNRPYGSYGRRLSMNPCTEQEADDMRKIIIDHSLNELPPRLFRHIISRVAATK